MVKLDLKDAYFTVSIWEKRQKFLRFIWKDNLFEFACLPFGLVSAPRVFTKLMKPVVCLLRHLVIRVIIYLDDLLIMAESKGLASSHATTALTLLEGLGFQVNFKKSVLSPTTVIEFLGFTVNSITITLSLPWDKVRNVKRSTNFCWTTAFQLSRSCPRSWVFSLPSPKQFSQPPSTSGTYRHTRTGPSA